MGCLTPSPLTAMYAHHTQPNHRGKKHSMPDLATTAIAPKIAHNQTTNQQNKHSTTRASQLWCCHANTNRQGTRAVSKRRGGRGTKEDDDDSLETPTTKHTVNPKQHHKQRVPKPQRKGRGGTTVATRNKKGKEKESQRLAFNEG